MTKLTKTKLEFTSPHGSKVTIERSFDNGMTMEEYILTMAKMGYSILIEEFEKSDLREEGVKC